VSYLERMDYRGICSYAEKCQNSGCSHQTNHVHHTWGSKIAGGPWSCVQEAHHCPYGETNRLVICKRTDNKSMEHTA